LHEVAIVSLCFAFNFREKSSGLGSSGALGGRRLHHQLLQHTPGRCPF
jgi:hypothetical protein